MAMWMSALTTLIAIQEVYKEPVPIMVVRCALCIHIKEQSQLRTQTNYCAKQATNKIGSTNR